MAKHNEIGKIGETIVSNFLIRKGFKLITANYRKKWGEIDLVTLKDKKLHFVEVKTVSRTSYQGKFPKEINNYKPEDNMHPWKLQRLSRAVQTYLLDKNVPEDMDWQFDLVTVYIDQVRRLSKVFILEDIVL